MVANLTKNRPPAVFYPAAAAAQPSPPQRSANILE
jgi:hypothetical protein